jgi:hypothetical protein
MTSTNDPNGAQFEIKVDGTVRSFRYHREDAIEAAQFLQQRHPGVRIQVTDLRDGSNVPFPNAPHEHPKEFSADPD